MSQEKLGAVVGVSFQMIQRYECGSTGIPVSSLFELANALNVHPLLLFQGPRLTAKDPLCARETIELVHAYLAIHDPTVRQALPRRSGQLPQHRYLAAALEGRCCRRGVRVVGSMANP
jgi:transcriptional regulator with XRE-family HTH domain